MRRPPFGIFGSTRLQVLASGGGDEDPKGPSLETPRCLGIKESGIYGSRNGVFVGECRYVCVGYGRLLGFCNRDKFQVQRFCIWMHFMFLLLGFTSHQTERTGWPDLGSWLRSSGQGWLVYGYYGTTKVKKRMQVFTCSYIKKKNFHSNSSLSKPRSPRQMWLTLMQSCYWFLLNPAPNDPRRPRLLTTTRTACSTLPRIENPRLHAWDCYGWGRNHEPQDCSLWVSIFIGMARNMPWKPQCFSRFLFTNSCCSGTLCLSQAHRHIVNTDVCCFDAFPMKHWHKITRCRNSTVIASYVGFR